MFNTAGFSAPKRSVSATRKRAVTTTKTNVSGTYNTATGTYAPSSTTVITTTSSSTQNQSSEMACGKPATTDNVIAKRLCASAYSDALDLYCKNTTCTSAIKVAMNMNFGIPLLSKENEKGEIPVIIDVNGTQCYGNDLDKFCSNFAEELVSGLWPLYSDQAKRERKTCNFAKAKFNAAQECFTYILSEKNNAGITGFFDTKKLNDIDKGIEKRCGKQAIIDNYEKISIDGWDSNDDALFFNEKSNAVSGKAGTGANKKLSSSVATQFANIGNANWNISGKVGRFLDLDWDLKTSTYPREIVVLANTFITDGETSCGSKFRTEMQDTSFEIKNKQSNLEREIAKKGLLKGLFDYSINQASAIMGEEWADNVKGEGIINSIKNAVDKKNNKPVYTSQKEKINELLNSCKDYKEDEFTAKIKGFTDKISTALDNILSAKKITVAKSYTNSFNLIETDLNTIAGKTKDPKIEITGIPEITETSSDDDVKTAINKIRTILTKLENANYDCDFKLDIENKELTYTVQNYTPTTWNDEDIKNIKQKFLNSAIFTDIESATKENTENWNIIEQLKKIEGLGKMLNNLDFTPIPTEEK
ncbi:hypothetical protein HDR59_02145 [bacterium]|nr:hypothetical protein [bacterium]